MRPDFSLNIVYIRDTHQYFYKLLTTATVIAEAACLVGSACCDERPYKSFLLDGQPYIYIYIYNTNDITHPCTLSHPCAFARTHTTQPVHLRRKKTKVSSSKNTTFSLGIGSGTCSCCQYWVAGSRDGEAS